MCWKTIIALLGGVVALCPACGAPPHKVPSPHLPLARYAATATVESGKVTRVSVSCQPGEQVLGGGFSSGGLFEYAAFLEASYPSSPTTWSVMAFGPTFGLEAEVYCLPTHELRNEVMEELIAECVGELAQSRTLRSGEVRDTAE